MNDLLLLVLVTSVIVLVIGGIKRKSIVYEFGFLFGCAVLGFLVLQIIGNRYDPMIPQDGTTIVLIMGILSVWMVHWGQSVARVAGPVKFDWAFHDRYLIVGAILLAAIGTYFMMLVYRLGPEQIERQWTGPITIYYFLARCLVYALILACVIYLRTGSKVALALIVLVFVLYLERLLVGGRRGDLIEILLIPVLAMWFQRGVALPRSLVIGAIVAMTLLVHSIGDYRNLAPQVGPVQALKKVEWVENAKKVYEQGGEEVKNAAYELSALDRRNQFDFGLFHWNNLVHAYVPGQILGRNFKQELMFDVEDVMFIEYGYEPIPGSTSSGLTDAYRSFWYFGALIFFAISYVMTRLFEAGSRGNLLCQFFYMACIAGALHTVTHHTGWFYIAFINAVIFMGPFLIFARREKRRVAFHSSRSNFGSDA